MTLEEALADNARLRAALEQVYFEKVHHASDGPDDVGVALAAVPADTLAALRELFDYAQNDRSLSDDPRLAWLVRRGG